MPEISNTPPTNTVTAPKENNSDKILGYVLLIIGILIIVATALYAYLVLTGKQQAPKVLNIEAPTLSIPSPSQSLNLSSLEATGVPKELLNSLQTQSQTPQNTNVKLLKDADLSALLNIGVFYFFVMFMTTVGAKIASIGVQLIKDIKVKVKS